MLSDDGLGSGSSSPFSEDGLMRGGFSDVIRHLKLVRFAEGRMKDTIERSPELKGRKEMFDGKMTSTSTAKDKTDSMAVVMATETDGKDKRKRV